MRRLLCSIHVLSWVARVYELGQLDLAGAERVSWHLPPLCILKCPKYMPPIPAPLALTCTVEELQNESTICFGQRPCRWQNEIALQLINGESLVSISATGSGKSYIFWLPMPYENGLTLMIIPLKTLGQQLADESCQRGFCVVSVTAELLGKSPTLFEVQ